MMFFRKWFLNMKENEKIITNIEFLKEEIEEEKKTVTDHFILFEQTLRQLGEDKRIINKYMKRLDCLLRTTQIFICICIILFSVLFLNVFN